MSKIKVCHLYYDLMNLYGENANIRAIEKMCEYQGITCEVSLKTINDKIDFNSYDIYYMGSGDEKSELLVLEDMIKYKDKIKASIESGKTFIITGNASELFGSYIIDNDVKYDALSVFNYNSVHETFRIVGSVTFSTNLIKEKIIGFQNRCGIMNDIDKPLFKVINGTGSSINSKTEGIHYKNFYATYVFGPLLIRNPYFTNYILKNIMKEKNPKYKFKIISKTNEVKAYNKYLENFNIETETI